MIKFKKTIVILALLVNIYPMKAIAANKTFTSSGQILPGETWNNVYIQNIGTIVDMSGGQVNYLSIQGANYFNMSGGQINTYIYAENGSTVNIYDGIVNLSSDFIVDGSLTSISHLNIMGGNVTAKVLKAYPTSNIEFTGGILNFDTFNIMGELTIKGGSLNVNYAYIGYGPYPAMVNVYGYGFNYNPTGGNLGEGILTGYLLDNNFFSINGLSESEFQSFNLIPEPATLALFAIGSLAILRRRR
ncbi:MAG: PEP-CTERM sorting domain-containing protein [Sedimentisphaerales bacterium]|jgi:hypothetical protein